jgi:hypothetical protein
MKIRAAVSPTMNQMKTRMVFFAGAVAMALGMMQMAPVASAEMASQVTVPFAFSINHQAFPAGHYRVVMDADNYVRLRSYETGDSAGVLVHSSRSFETSPKNSLIFLHNEQGYQLMTVRFGQGALQTEAALQTKLERVIAKNASETRAEVGVR